MWKKKDLEKNIVWEEFNPFAEGVTYACHLGHEILEFKLQYFTTEIYALYNHRFQLLNKEKITIFK